MKSVIVYGILIVLIICIFMLPNKNRHREGMNTDLKFGAPGGGQPKNFYGRPGVRSVPFDIPIPRLPIRGQDHTFISYPGVDWKIQCPSPPGTKCRNYTDCGPAELCIDQAGWIADEEPDNVQPESAVCVCSFQNSCITEGIC